MNALRQLWGRLVQPRRGQDRAAAAEGPRRAPGKVPAPQEPAAPIAWMTPVPPSGAPAHDLQARAARVAALPEGAAVPSPCIDVCQIEPTHGLCRGCRRTLDEIAAWGGMTASERRAVWALLPARPRPD